LRRTVLTLTIIYFVVLLAGWTWIALTDNQYWLVTMFLLSPRWVTALPMFVMVPWTLAVRPKILWSYTLHLGVILVGIMGLNVNRMYARPSSPDDVLVMSCNVGGSSVEAKRIAQFVRQHDISVVLLQECQPLVAQMLFADLNWNFRQQSNFAIGSRYPLSDAQAIARHPNNVLNAIAAIAVLVELPGGNTSHFVSVHLPTFRPAFEYMQYRDLNRASATVDEIGRMHREVAGEILAAVAKFDSPVVIAGDFNLTTDTSCYREHWSKFQNAFDIAGNGFGYTKYTRYHGVRIDHLLCSDQVVVQTGFVGVHFGGDHCPLVAELSIGGKR
jgi:endonuclease/exonuclease/phosphatase (EEP) superfamily protein YafD